jgi:hypothetical protein
MTSRESMLYGRQEEHAPASGLLAGGVGAYSNRSW